ncbi:hypothetical protein OIB37_33520 [Streptomyces sp. NBC_00820]|uniref:hypothetical protein n=1 Tax=Streptomyces sp. NBC_00820 TaxID=2975842 RepID=UPI002ECFE73F|nr:hypothetical protein OIB37_33520 [Streptomyces sp. NBC_00820]
MTASKLNGTGYDHAKRLIEQGRFVADKDDWQEVQPSAQQENAFIEAHGFGQFAEWYLGVNEQEPEETKARYSFPYGDFDKVHRSGLVAVESRAGQYKHHDIERAARHLRELIDERA